MRIINRYLLLALLIAVGFSVEGCGSGGSSPPPADNGNPGSEVTFEDPVVTALKEGDAVKGPAKTDCDNSSFVLEAVNTLCELFGAGSCLKQTSTCNDYQRQIYTGSYLGLSTGNKKAWNGRGGSGPLMADAALCTLRELSPKVPGGGPIISEKSLDIGIGDVKVRQEVGYLDFDLDTARFKGYRKLRVELPVLGKFDAITQNIDLQKAYYGTTFNPNPYAGDYPILFGYALNLSSEEKSKSLTIKPPAFDITTPIGIFEAQPDFCYESNTVVADTPFVTDHTDILLPNDPADNSEAAIHLYDLYGVIPGVENNAILPPNHIDYKDKRTGWGSQAGLGTRGSRSGNNSACKGPGGEKLWSPPNTGFFSRPDYDPFGVLPFESYESRSNEENLPSVYARASASVKYPDNPKDLLPGWVFGLPGLDFDAYIKVTPTVEAGAAGQFGLAVSEGTDNQLMGEFKALATNRTSALGIYSGVEADASFKVDTELKIYVSAVFDFFFGEKTITLVDINPHFPIPLAGDKVSSGVKLATAVSTSGSGPDFPETLDALNTFTGSKSDPQDFIHQCYSKQKEIPPEEPPTSTTEKGDPADLFEFLPCNICVATDAVVDPDTGEEKEPAHRDILAPVDPTPPAVWQCDAKAKSGCMDLCKLNKETGEFTVVKNPSQIADSMDPSTPDYADLYNLYKSCNIPCEGVTSPIYFGSITACKGLDSTPPGLLGFMVPGGGGGGGPAPVPVDTNIIASFSEPMDPTSINTNTFTVNDADGYPVLGNVSYDADTYSGVFTPLRSFEYDTTYRVTVTTGVTDITGTPLPADASWDFTTEAAPPVSDTTPPTVISTDPLADARDVAVTTPVTITFSEPIDPSTVSGSIVVFVGGETVTGTFSFDGGDTVVIFTPDVAFESNQTYTVLVTAGVMDIAGNPMTADVTWTFTTVQATRVSKAGW